MEDNKKKIILISILTVILLAVIIGSTYAYFSYVNKSEKKVITSGSLDVSYSESSVLNVDTNTIPILDEDYLTQASNMTFTITNNGTLSAYSTIKMHVTYKNGVVDGVEQVDSAKTSDYKWALRSGEENISSGTFASGSDVITISNMEYLEGKTTDTVPSKTYTLYVWVSETWAEQEELKNSGLSIGITVDSTSDSPKTLNYKVLGDKYSNVLDSDFNITNDFTCDEATCTKNFSDGLYKSVSTTNNYPTYYYRGAVENNYVKLGKYASNVTYTYQKLDASSTINYKTNQDLLFRVIRINEDGSIKLISDTINSSSISYDNLEASLQTFYNTQLARFDSKIVIENYCSDEYLYANTRINNNNPTFACETALLNYKKYGSLTLDELMFTGAYSTDTYSVSKSFLNNGTWFYTQSNGSLLNPSTNLIVQDQNISTPSARIVINLDPNVVVSSGSGTIDAPWVIQ